MLSIVNMNFHLEKLAICDKFFIVSWQVKKEHLHIDIFMKKNKIK